MIDLVSPGLVDAETLRELGPLLLEQGVDLVSAPSPEALRDGTPLYVDVNADPVHVQRLIALAHVRMLFVLDRGTVVGVVDTADLCARAESLEWPTGASP